MLGRERSRCSGSVSMSMRTVVVAKANHRRRADLRTRFWRPCRLRGRPG
jgi:hypothetical protein